MGLCSQVESIVHQCRASLFGSTFSLEKVQGKCLFTNAEHHSKTFSLACDFSAKDQGQKEKLQSF